MLLREMPPDVWEATAALACAAWRCIPSGSTWGSQKAEPPGNSTQVLALEGIIFSAAICRKYIKGHIDH